jgi:hypothetical protein
VHALHETLLAIHARLQSFLIHAVSLFRLLPS